MTTKMLVKGEKGNLPCELCGVLFEHIGNGEWVPTCCPRCKERGGYIGLVFDLMALTSEEEDAIAEIERLCEAA